MQNRIRELRKQRGMTMKELGKVIGAAESTVSHYETGRRQPDNKTLLILAEFFGVSVDYILGKPQTQWPAVLFDDVGRLDFHSNLSPSTTVDPTTQKILDATIGMTDEEKRQLLLAARLIVEQRSEK